MGGRCLMLFRVSIVYILGYISFFFFFFCILSTQLDIQEGACLMELPWQKYVYILVNMRFVYGIGKLVSDIWECICRLSLNLLTATLTYASHTLNPRHLPIITSDQQARYISERHMTPVTHPAHDARWNCFSIWLIPYHKYIPKTPGSRFAFTDWKTILRSFIQRSGNRRSMR